MSCSLTVHIFCLQDELSFRHTPKCTDTFKRLEIFHAIKSNHLWETCFPFLILPPALLQKMLSAFRVVSLNMVFILHQITHSLLPTSMWSHVGLEHIEGYWITWLFVTCKIDTKFIIVQLTWFQISDIINHNRKECNSRSRSGGGDFRLRFVLYVGWKPGKTVHILSRKSNLWNL